MRRRINSKKIKTSYNDPYRKESKIFARYSAAIMYDCIWNNIGNLFVKGSSLLYDFVIGYLI